MDYLKDYATGEFFGTVNFESDSPLLFKKNRGCPIKTLVFGSMLAIALGMVFTLWMVSRSAQPMLFKYEPLNSSEPQIYDDEDLFYPYMEDFERSNETSWTAIVCLTTFLLTLIVWKRMAALTRRVDGLECDVDDLATRCRQAERREVALLDLFNGALQQAGFWQRN